MTNLVIEMRSLMARRKYNGAKSNQHTVDLGGFKSAYEIVGEL